MSETTNQAPVFDGEFRANLLKLFSWRRDVRHFRHDPVPDETLARLIETSCLAPSVGLSEPWRFVIVETANRRKAIRECFLDSNAEALRAQDNPRSAAYARLKLEGLDEAPVHIAVFSDSETAQGYGLGRQSMPETVEYSAVMAIHTLWLAARAEGIGMGWVSILDPSRVREILEVPEDWRFVAYLCLGFPVEENDTPKLERDGWEHRRPPPSRLLRR